MFRTRYDQIVLTTFNLSPPLDNTDNEDDQENQDKQDNQVPTLTSTDSMKIGELRF